MKHYLDEMEGITLQDVWTDIAPLSAQAAERRGYPTQKPLALLERIIAASSNEGDVVLDPFAGCGTAIVAAERMHRSWIGIDVTYLAINEIVDRLKTETRAERLVNAPGQLNQADWAKLVATVKEEPVSVPSFYEILGTPRDEEAARALFRETEKQNHKPFEQWAVTLVGGKYNDKKGADRGVDGRIQLWDQQGNYREGAVQVKGGNSCTLSAVRDFGRVIERENAVFGIMICQREVTKEMRIEAESLGYADWPGSKQIPRYQILTTEGILERGEQPILPQSWLISPERGVGKAVAGQTETLFDEQE